MQKLIIVAVLIASAAYVGSLFGQQPIGVPPPGEALRYSTEVGIAGTVAITDHYENKLYVYVFGGKKEEPAELQAVIDLTQTGQETLKNEHTPTTQPAAK